MQIKHNAVNTRSIAKDVLRKLIIVIAAVVLFSGISSFFYYLSTRVSAEEASTVAETVSTNLQNGSFEKDQTWASTYTQVTQDKVPYWNTTAFQGKIELFKENSGTYIRNGNTAVRLKPTDGNIAAELNADEESTLYQIVRTTPSSIYQWGLDHGSRNGTDTMALIIGPSQTNVPSKPSKKGRDQFMQMVDWLIEQKMTSVKTEAGLGEQITVYSKKFGTKGTFEDNAGGNAFSKTPSSIYTEKWKVWIIADSKAADGVTVNPWGKYGSNAENENDDSSGSSGSKTEIDFNKYYYYNVPAEQNSTLFAFVSVGYNKSIAPVGKEKTFGNFLDNINFKLYHPLSGSTTNHGSAVVVKSDGTIQGGTVQGEYTVTVDGKLTTYVDDGGSLKIQAVVKKQNSDDGCDFIGAYYTKVDENGNSVVQFMNLADNVVEDDGTLTEEQKAGKWVLTHNDAGDLIYTYCIENITNPTDLHFVFVKSPTVTYEPNGGKPYVIPERWHTDESENVYSFKPIADVVDPETGLPITYIPPYVSKAAEGYEGWKFIGWKLTGDKVVDSSGNELVNADKLDSLILPAEHTIACDYSLGDATTIHAPQYFKVYSGNTALTKNPITDEEQYGGVKWTDSGEEKLYANMHKGITMVAQWRWRQAIFPMIVDKNGTVSESTDGGTVEFTRVTDTSDENYIANYTENGAKAYHATTSETVTIKAVPKEGCTFIGWYDSNGDLISTKLEYTFTEKKESVKNFYAHFSNTVTQTYIRQLKNGDAWDDIDDDSVGTLDRYTYVDAVGNQISSTATAKTGYRFVGWYDSEGNPVADDMIVNNVTISYITSGDATYYARFVTAYTLNVSKIDGDKSTESKKVPLAGAEFSLYKKDDSGTKSITYEGQKIKCSLIETVATVLNSSKTQATASFKDKLVLGEEYYLIEKKAPSGYRLLESAIKVTIDDSGASALIDGISKEITKKEVNIELANYLTLTVPLSGGLLTGDWFTAAGTSLLVAAAIGLFGFGISRLKNKKTKF